MLSMFTGFLGADQFYLGFPAFGFIKLFTLGGCGIWWVADIIRIGSAPIMSANYQVASDLPHYVFVLSCTMFAVAVGFYFAFTLTVGNRASKRREAMILQSDEDGRQKDAIKPFADVYTTGMTKPVVQFQPSPSYGAMGGGQGQMPQSMMMGMGQMPPGMGMGGQMPPTMGMGQMPPTMGMGQMPPTMGMGPMGGMGSMGQMPPTMGMGRMPGMMP